VPTLDTSAAQLLAADVVDLELRLSRAEQELRIVRLMLSEMLDLAHRSIAYVYTLETAARR